MVQRVGDVDISEIRERLNLRAGARANRERPPLFSTANLDPHYRPVRGFLFSVVGHGAICVLLAFIPLLVGMPEIEDFDNAVIVPVDELADVLYLPLLGSNDLKLPEAPAPAEKPRSPTAQRAKEGLSYPGLQSILSDPPNATNHTQTLLQPALVNPAILHSLTLPNIVRMAEVPRPVAPVVESRFKAIDMSDPIAASITPIARLDVPLTPATLRAPVPPMVEKPNPNQDLLALSPTPARADQPVVIPAGEMRGRFAISPTPNLSFPGTEPGINGEPKADENAPAIANTPAPNAVDNAPKSSGTSNSPFAGITIVGGINGAGTLPSAIPEPLQTSYGITILSSGGSGGGLRDYGVFGNEQVQTVYLDMRRSISDRPVSWTAEYAVGQKDITPANGVLNISIRQEVVLPFPVTKELPVWPEDLARKYKGRMIIAFALISTDGKIERPTIKESPDPLLNTAVISALEKWTFRAARRDGEIVPAKILIGIPVSQSE